MPKVQRFKSGIPKIGTKIIIVSVAASFFDDWIPTVSVVEVLKAVFSTRGKSAVFYWCGFGVGLGWGWQSRSCQVVDATGCDADEVSLAITATMMSLQILCCCYAHDLSCTLAATLIKLHIYIICTHTRYK